MDRFLLVHVPGALLGLLTVTVAVGVSVAGLFLVRRKVPLERLEEQNDVAGFIVAVVGALYGVLLAFVVVIVWQRFDTSITDASHEAMTITVLYRDAALFPDQTGPIRQTLRDYADSVVKDEWPAMAQHQTDNPRTDQLVEALVRDYRAVHIQSTEENTFFDESVKRVYALGDARRARLDDNTSQLPGLLWIVLIGGGMITVAFTYFFGVKPFGSQVLMVGALAAMFALTLFLVLELNHPFVGSLRVNPDAMERAIREFGHL